MLTKEEGILAVKYARSCITSAIKNSPRNITEVPAVFNEKRGVFVTLTTQEGHLRGCIGYPYPIFPLKEALCDAAIAAATEDPRFYPVGESELNDVCVEVSILTLPKKISGSPENYPQKIKIGRENLSQKLSLSCNSNRTDLLSILI